MDIDPEIIKIIFKIIILVCVILLFIGLFFPKDEKEELKELISQIKTGDEKERRNAARRLIKDFLPKQQYQQEVMLVIGKYMPSSWYNKALDVMYPPEKSKELAK